MKQPSNIHLNGFIVGLCGLLVLLTLVGGIAFITGVDHRGGGAAHRIIGLVMVVGATVVLGATVRRWAKWFFAICFLMTVKALFALVFGYTVSQPRLIVDRAYAAAVLSLLVAMLCLSYRFVLRPPRSRMDSVSLVVAVVGLSASVLIEGSLWLLIGSVLLLSFALLVSKIRVH